MRSRTSIPWILALVGAAASLALAVRGEAHPGHAAEPLPSPEGPSAAADPSVVGRTRLFTTVLARCLWEGSSSTTWAGGTLAACDENMFPVSSGVYIANYSDPVHDHLVNLSPAIAEWNGVGVDGILDGEGLSDSHPAVHGEPPPHTTTAEQFANTPKIAGSGVHYNYTGDDDPNEIRTLCCESLDDSSKNELESCRYETALVPVQPETHPDLAGQYSAHLACSSGRVTSGGCYAQFLHDSEWGLTSSHPYVGGNTLAHPSGSHSSTPGETGWACRLDREPEMYANQPYDEAIGITVLCCS